MKIWTIERFIDGMPQIEVCHTEAAADLRFDAHYRALWAEVMDIEPFPENADTAHGILSGESVSDSDLMWITCHDITDHPDIAAAIETLDEAEAIVLHAKKEEEDLSPGELIDVYDAIADASSMLRGKMAADHSPAFGISPNLQDHVDSVTDAYRKVAIDQADDGLEVDPEAYVAISDDGDGAFVAAWLWVPESDAAKHMPPLPQETMQ